MHLYQQLSLEYFKPHIKIHKRATIDHISPIFYFAKNVSSLIGAFLRCYAFTESLEPRKLMNIQKSILKTLYD